MGFRQRVANPPTVTRRQSEASSWPAPIFCIKQQADPLGANCASGNSGSGANAKRASFPHKSASCFGRAYAVRSILFCSKCAQRRENRSQRRENRYRWCISNDQNIFEVHRGHRCFHGHGRAYEGSMSFAATRVKGADCHVVCCFSLAAMSRKRSTRRHCQ